MFYSQTFLGRKGPLGTVWCAAHLQHRLKKSHYTSTDIPKTVDYIMYSEVPIALRMSGHLLLGVVRIYSKKVEYLFKDCNFILTGLSKLFTSSMDLNLPENARQAPVQSVTLPQTFELDALDIDDSHYHEAEDSHLRSQEEITLTDQVPGLTEPFIAITFDEDSFGTPQSAERQNSGVRSMEEGNTDGEGNGPPLQDPGPSYQTEAQNGNPHEEAAVEAVQQEESSMHSIPEIEIMREADSELRVGSPFNVPLRLDDTGDDRGTEPVMNEQDMVPPDMKEVRTPTSAFPVDQQLSGQKSSASIGEAPENFDANNSFGPNFVIGPSPHLEIRPSPRAEQPPPPRRRKRKHFFDEVVVLTNRSMRRSLNDTSDILRKRKLNSSLLDLWKLSKRQRKERIFEHPLITGMSGDLVAVSDKYYMSTKACSIPSAEVPPDPMATDENTVPIAEESFPDQTVLNSPAVDHGFDLEIERLRQHDEIGTGPGAVHDLLSSPPKAGLSSTRRSEHTPFSDNDMSLLSEIPQSTTVGSADQSMPDLGMSTGPSGSDLDTPMTFSGGEFGLGENRLSDIQELDTSEELNFLEADNTSPSSSCSGQGGDSLSMRTRAVAQFLKRQSPTAEGQSENLSLNKILEGKKRKLCARMFYETLLSILSKLMQEHSYKILSVMEKRLRSLLYQFPRKWKTVENLRSSPALSILQEKIEFNQLENETIGRVELENQVLKSYGLVDVQQEEPYGDISLALTPTFSKAQL